MSFSEILANVGFDWRMALFNLFNILVIYLVLKRYVFGAIGSALEKRQKQIQDGIDNAEKARTELFMAEQKAQALIDDAKVEANKVIEKAADEARVITDKMKDKAKAEIELLVTQAKKNIEIDRQEMQEKLKAETVDLVIATTKAVLGKQLDSTVDETLIKDSIAQ